MRQHPDRRWGVGSDRPCSSSSHKPRQVGRCCRVEQLVQGPKPSRRLPPLQRMLTYEMAVVAQVVVSPSSAQPKQLYGRWARLPKRCVLSLLPATATRFRARVGESAGNPGCPGRTQRTDVTVPTILLSRTRAASTCRCLHTRQPPSNLGAA